MVGVVKRIVKDVMCITWHGEECVMNSFLSDEFAQAEAAIMILDLMHPHVVLLIGYICSWQKLTQSIFAALTRYSPGIYMQKKGIMNVTISRIWTWMWKRM